MSFLKIYENYTFESVILESVILESVKIKSVIVDTDRQPHIYLINIL